VPSLHLSMGRFLPLEWKYQEKEKKRGDNIYPCVTDWHAGNTANPLDGLTKKAIHLNERAVEGWGSARQKNLNEQEEFLATQRGGISVGTTGNGRLERMAGGLKKMLPS